MDNLISIALDILIVIVCVYMTLTTNKQWVRIVCTGGLMVSLIYLVTAVSYISLSTYGFSWIFLAHLVLGCVSATGAVMFLLATCDII